MWGEGKFPSAWTSPSCSRTSPQGRGVKLESQSVVFHQHPTQRLSGPFQHFPQAPRTESLPRVPCPQRGWSDCAACCDARPLSPVPTGCQPNSRGAPKVPVIDYLAAATQNKRSASPGSGERKGRKPGWAEGEFPSSGIHSEMFLGAKCVRHLCEDERRAQREGLPGFTWLPCLPPSLTQAHRTLQLPAPTGHLEQPVNSHLCKR